ncbi:MAG: nucleotidyltransferase domain-containing protein [Nanoarchaeota archaeon]
MKELLKNTEQLLKIKNEFSKILKDKEIQDIIVFGSLIKGKATPQDIDIAIISEKQEFEEKEGYHISLISPNEFLSGSLTLSSTLIREGYSLKHNCFFSEIFRFKSKSLFSYSLSNLPASKKVQFVNILRGKNGSKGLVEENKGEWLANQVFILPIDSDYLFDKLFENFSIKYKKSYILIH